MFSYVKLILLKIQNSLMLGTVYDSSILYIKTKVATQTDRIFESFVFVLIHANYPVSFVHSDSLFLFDQISLENLNNNDTGYKTI